MRYRFTDNFWFGCAESATQTEGFCAAGGKTPSNWDHAFKSSTHRFFNQTGPEETRGFWQNYREDIQLMRETGINSYRTSLSWARLMPDGYHLDEAAAAGYRDIILCLKEAGIEPVITLMHFDLPFLMQQKGGWLSAQVVDAFVRYAETCFDQFGDLVSHWITFNEPIVPVEGGYLYDFHYPFKRDFASAARAAFNTQLAHARAVNLFHERRYAGKIGIVLNLTPSYPRSEHPADVYAAEIADLFFNKSFLEPSLNGRYPEKLIALLKHYDQLPVVSEDDLQIIAHARVDMLGVNYYHPRRVQARQTAINPASPFMPDWFFDAYEMPGRIMNTSRGWEIYPQGIYDILTDLRLNYGNIPVFISENGMGVENEERWIEAGQVNDAYRIDFIRQHLIAVHQAINEGSHCFGYHCWTFIDNWSWLNGYKNRYGLYRLDLKNMQRTPKASAQWYAALIKNNGLN